MAKATKQTKGVAQEAHDAIHGSKRAAYGPVDQSFNRIATIASIGCNKVITAEDIAMIMIALKYCREAHKHSRDNLVDICGYADLKQQLLD